MTNQEASEKINELFSKRFSIKDVGLSYRVINDWSEKGLIDHFREGDKGWHRFSFSELAEILIYKELRNVGFSIEKLKKVKSFLNKKFYEKKVPFFFEINNLNICVIIVLTGQNNFLVIDSEAKKICFSRDIKLTEIIGRKNPSEVKEYGKNNALVVLNIRRLIDSLGILYQVKDEKLGLVAKEILSEQANQELKIVTDGSGNIKKVKTIRYEKPGSFKSVNKLIRQPNQKTTFHSNKHDVQSVVIEKELK